MGVWLGGQWAGYQATREEALALALTGREAQGLWLVGAPSDVLVVHVQSLAPSAAPPESTGEWAVYRVNHQVGIAQLERGRFGWKPVWSETWPDSFDQDAGRPSEPAAVRITVPQIREDHRGGARSDGEGDAAPVARMPIVWGEIFDHRVTQVEVMDERYPVGNRGPFFIIPVPDGLPVQGSNPPERGWVRLLDARGEPLSPAGGEGQ